jgi:hypothetical protein
LTLSNNPEEMDVNVPQSSGGSADGTYHHFEPRIAATMDNGKTRQEDAEDNALSE